jgi:hypothetical protein
VGSKRYSRAKLAVSAGRKLAMSVLRSLGRATAQHIRMASRGELMASGPTWWRLLRVEGVKPVSFQGALLALVLDLDTCVCMICEELAGALFTDPPRCKSPALARGARMCKTSLDALSSSSRLRRQGLANVLYFMLSRSASEVDRLRRQEEARRCTPQHGGFEGSEWRARWE